MYSLPSSQKALNQHAVSPEMHSRVGQQAQRSVNAFGFVNDFSSYRSGNLLCKQYRINLLL